MSASRNSINLLTSLLLAAALCLGQVTYSTAENDDAGQTRQQLKEVTSKIKKLQKRIKGFKQEKNSLRTELSKTEKAIGKVQPFCKSDPPPITKQTTRTNRP